MSCLPHRVTSGQSNSVHKQANISKLLPHIHQPSVKPIYKTNNFANIKHTHTNIRIFFPEELVLLILPLLKAHTRLGHAGIVDQSVEFINTRLKKEKNKEKMDRHNVKKKKKKLYKCIMANTSAVWQQAAHTTYQLLSPSCSTRAIQKSLTLKNNV